MPEINSFISSILSSGPSSPSTSTILSGSAAPLPSKGSVGNVYIDSSVPALYGPKTASGWSALAEPIGVANPLTIPSGAVGLYSFRRSYSWTGLCCKVVRSSDNAELDVGFVNNVADYKTVLAWAGDDLVRISIWYDQSGSGNNLTQTDNGSRPLFYANKLYGRGPSAVIDVGNNLKIPSTLSVNRQSLSVWMVGKFNQHAQPLQGYWGFGQTSGAPDVALVGAINAYSLQAQVAGDFSNSGSVRHIPTLSKCISGLNSSSAELTFHRDNLSSTAGPLTTATLNTGGYLGISAPGGYTSKCNMEAFVIYPSSLSSGTVATLKSSFRNTFITDVDAPTRVIATHGDSIMYGYTGSEKNRSWTVILSDYYDANTLIASCSHAGHTLEADKGFRVNYLDPIVVNGAQNILFVQYGTNDLGGNRTAAQLYGDLTQYVQGNGTSIASAASVGWNRVIASTILPRTDTNWTAEMESNRIAYNNMLRTTNLPILIYDAANDPVVGGASTTNQTIYSGDRLHPAPLAYTYLAPALAEVINSP